MDGVIGHAVRSFDCEFGPPGPSVTQVKGVPQARRILPAEMSRHREPVSRHLIAAVARARPDERVEAVRAPLAHEKPVSLELVLVVGTDGRLSGVVPIARDFFRRRRGADERDDGAAISRAFGADADQERAASLALHHGVDALPVVDAGGRPLGVMPLAGAAAGAAPRAH